MQKIATTSATVPHDSKHEGESITNVKPVAPCMVHTMGPQNSRGIVVRMSFLRAAVASA